MRSISCAREFLLFRYEEAELILLFSVLGEFFSLSLHNSAGRDFSLIAYLVVTEQRTAGTNFLHTPRLDANNLQGLIMNFTHLKLSLATLLTSFTTIIPRFPSKPPKFATFLLKTLNSLSARFPILLRLSKIPKSPANTLVQRQLRGVG